MVEFDFEKFKKEKPEIEIPKEREKQFVTMANGLAAMFNMVWESKNEDKKNG